MGKRFLIQIKVIFDKRKWILLCPRFSAKNAVLREKVISIANNKIVTQTDAIQNSYKQHTKKHIHAFKTHWPCLSLSSECWYSVVSQNHVIYKHFLNACILVSLNHVTVNRKHWRQ